MNKQISILGCGWLGLPLAKTLTENGFSVKGSTTSMNKLSILEENKIEPFLISLFEDKIEGDIIGLLKNSEILIVNVPPGLRKNNSISFVDKVKTLISFVEKTKLKKIIFISSTSVYGDEEFISTPIEVTEETTPNPDTESGKQLVKVEQILLENKNFDTIILRFGGLIGPDRHPITFLSGKDNVENPNAPINFIHLEDCIQIIYAIISIQDDCKLKNQIFNAVAPTHPKKIDYYNKKAKNMNLALPKFVENPISKGKVVSSKKIILSLNYRFKNLFE